MSCATSVSNGAAIGTAGTVLVSLGLAVGVGPNSIFFEGFDLL